MEGVLLMEDIFAYNKSVQKLREFFVKQQFIEIPTQSRLSILAACEDPNTVSQFIFGGINYPLPQTGQMWLEYELLKNPNVPGVYCISTSYRNEPNPIPGRHDKIFPMFEFESFGDIDDLIILEKELIHFLGFDRPKRISYEEACDVLKVESLSSSDESKLEELYGSSIFLEKFPQRTHPFWNMKEVENSIFNKVDVLLYGMETIGSAERSTNVDEMRNNFKSISDGLYAKLLYNLFGEKRVLDELETYLSLPMVSRFGAGIGITRLARAMKLKEKE